MNSIINIIFLTVAIIFLNLSLISKQEQIYELQSEMRIAKQLIQLNREFNDKIMIEFDRRLHALEKESKK